MRPVNLIPPDERRGDAAPLRTGKLVYVLVAGLALLLLGVVGLAVTNKQISDRQDKKAGLEQELSAATARASSLAACSNFRAVQEQRAATIQSLAQSRFDWSRVLHELSLVLPSDISLGSVTGTVSPDVDIDSAGGSASGGTDLRSGIAGPALDISGCAPSQDSVAAFVASLEEIDGVTRVGLDSSGKGEAGAEGASGSGGSSGSGNAECTSGPITYKFHVVVAFDAVPAPATATGSPSVPAPTAPSAGGTQQVASTQTPGGS